MGNCSGSANNTKNSSRSPPSQKLGNKAQSFRRTGTNKKNSFRSQYRTGRELGRGGYSVVFEGYNVTDPNKTKRAIKVTDRASLTQADEEGLRDEVKILRMLNCPNVVACFDSCEEHDKFFIVLELLEGGELFDRIIQKSSYSEKDAREVILVLLNAIKYLHDRNIVHRDLKPENLLMASKSDDANLKIADFGFAKICHGNNLTTPCGSPAYVAPEIIGRHRFGKPVDMWAVGVITYIVLGGYPPFEDKDQRHLFRKIQKGLYEFHPKYWGHISDEAKDLIRRMLTVDPAKRITIDDALDHPWVHRSEEELAARNLDYNLVEFRKYNTLRKFRKAAHAVIAVNKMKNAMGFSSKSPTAAAASDTDLSRV